MKNLPQSTLLPIDAVQLLQQASKTTIPWRDPLAKAKAIDKAVEQIKRQYPQFFKE